MGGRGLEKVPQEFSWGKGTPASWWASLPPLLGHSGGDKVRSGQP